MSKKTLLLSASFQVLSFIPERKMYKLLIKDKVEVISTWDNEVNWIGGKIKQPSIIKLKDYVRKNYSNSNFSRKALVKRDKSTCQYCLKKLAASQITVDHVLPRAQGGVTSFTNCVVSCLYCNNRKADRTPEQAGLTLLKRPTHPSYSSHSYVSDPQEYWHEDWSDYLNGV